MLSADAVLCNSSLIELDILLPFSDDWLRRDLMWTISLKLKLTEHLHWGKEGGKHNRMNIDCASAYCILRNVVMNIKLISQSTEKPTAYNWRPLRIRIILRMRIASYFCKF